MKVFRTQHSYTTSNLQLNFFFCMFLELNKLLFLFLKFGLIICYSTSQSFFVSSKCVYNLFCSLIFPVESKTHKSLNFQCWKSK